MTNNDVSVVTEDQADVESIITMLQNGQLARRIADAARLAMVRHMVQNAQGIQSAVEAENSTT